MWEFPSPASLRGIAVRLIGPYGDRTSLDNLVPNQFSSVQSLSCVRLFGTPWTAVHQAFLSITNSWSLLKLMSIELVMPTNHLILHQVSDAV